jgi:hypothetical protein
MIGEGFPKLFEALAFPLPGSPAGGLLNHRQDRVPLRGQSGPTSIFVKASEETTPQIANGKGEPPRPHMIARQPLASTSIKGTVLDDIFGHFRKCLHYPVRKIRIEAGLSQPAKESSFIQMPPWIISCPVFRSDLFELNLGRLERLASFPLTRPRLQHRNPWWINPPPNLDPQLTGFGMTGTH